MHHHQLVRSHTVSEHLNFTAQKFTFFVICRSVHNRNVPAVFLHFGNLNFRFLRQILVVIIKKRYKFAVCRVNSGVSRHCAAAVFLKRQIFNPAIISVLFNHLLSLLLIFRAESVIVHNYYLYVRITLSQSRLYGIA